MKRERDDIVNYWPASSKRWELMTEDSEASVMNIYKNRRMDGEQSSVVEIYIGNQDYSYELILLLKFSFLLQNPILR